MDFCYLWKPPEPDTCPFINTFLQLDGTPYTNRQGWEAQDLFDECTNRDYRLSQTIHSRYMREGKKPCQTLQVMPVWATSHEVLCDATDGDSKTMNTNAIPLFRYAEVLLVCRSKSRIERIDR